MSTDPAEVPGDATASDARHERLARATSLLRRGTGGVPVERWLQMAGAVLLPLGLLLILLGWYGASRTSLSWKQTPYLISGGLFGLGVVFTGGFAYFVHWVTRLVAESRRHAQQAAETAAATVAALERIEALLRAQAGVVEARALVATASGTMAHRPDCPTVAGKHNLRPVAPGEPGLRPCLICEPELTPGNGSTSHTAARPGRPVRVRPTRG